MRELSTDTSDSEDSKLANDNAEADRKRAASSDEPLILEGRIVAAPVKIADSDARTIFLGFCVGDTEMTVKDATPEILLAATSVSLVVKATDETSRARIKAAALMMEIGITGTFAGGTTLMKYDVARGQLRRLLLKLSSHQKK